MSPTGTRTSKSADSLDGKTEGITPRITRRHFPNTSFPSSPLPAAAPASPSGSSSSPLPPASQIPSAIPAPREPLSQSAQTDAPLSEAEGNRRENTTRSLAHEPEGLTCPTGRRCPGMCAAPEALDSERCPYVCCSPRPPPLHPGRPLDLASETELRVSVPPLFAMGSGVTKFAWGFHLTFLPSLSQETVRDKGQ